MNECEIKRNTIKEICIESSEMAPDDEFFRFLYFIFVFPLIFTVEFCFSLIDPIFGKINTYLHFTPKNKSNNPDITIKT
jgi:hypothetical protein